MKHNVITGHYGSGKSNIAVNKAIEIKKNNADKPVYLIDADIVNPYFRSSESKEILEKNGINLIAPIYAGSNLDIPSLPPEINRVFGRDCIAVWDIGGDDAGAVVLGRFQSRISEQGYEMMHVVNAYRPLTESSEDMVGYLKDIEAISQLKTTCIINNSNLGRQTTPETVIESFEVVDKFSELCGLPIVYTAITENLKTMNGFELLVECNRILKIITLYTKEYF